MLEEAKSQVVFKNKNRISFNYSEKNLQISIKNNHLVTVQPKIHQEHKIDFWELYEKMFETYLQFSDFNLAGSLPIVTINNSSKTLNGKIWLKMLLDLNDIAKLNKGSSKEQINFS